MSREWLSPRGSGAKIVSISPSVPTMVMEQRPLTGANINWLFVIAFFLGATVGVLPTTSRLFLFSAGGLYFLESTLITQSIVFLVYPCILFVVIYIWSIRSIGGSGFLKQSYRRVLVFLFLGSVIGYVVFYFSLIFLLGGSSNFPNTVFIVTFLLSEIVGITEVGLGITFVGFTAIALAHLRKSGGL